MEKKIFVCLYIVVLLFSRAGAQTTVPPDSEKVGASLSIKQAVDLAIKNNLLVNQADIAAQTARVNLNQSWGNMLPNISAGASQGIGFGRSLVTSSYTYTDQQTISGSYQLNSNLVLFSGLYYQNSVRSNQYAYNASKLDLQQQKENITLNVLLSYLQILAAQDQLNILHEQADIDARQVDRLDALNKEGALLLLSDMTNLKGQYAGDLANIATQANVVEQAKITLFNYLNVPYKGDVEFDRNAFSLQIEDYSQGSDSIYQTALRTLPTIRSAELKIRSYERALAAARGNYFPTLSFYANVNSYYNNVTNTASPTGNFRYDTSTNNFVSVGGNPYQIISKSELANISATPWGDQFKNNRQTSLGIQLNIPILNYLRARNGVKQAKVNLKNSQINARSTRLVLQQNVESSYQNMMSSYKQYKAYMDQAAAYAESFRTTEIRFNEGVIAADIYLIAKNNVDRANINLAQAKYSYIFRTKVLDYYRGQLQW